MPSPFGTRGPVRAGANLKSKRLIYLPGNEIFRFIENNPYTCVQVVTYNITEPAFNENPEKPAGLFKPKEPKMQAVTREVQYWNCEGFEQGERRSG